MYTAQLRSKAVSALLSSGVGFDGALPAITKLRKLCNHPALLLDKGSDVPEEVADAVPKELPPNAAEMSGDALMCCSKLLRKLYQLF